MSRLAKVFVLVVAVVLLPSCATLFGGGGRQPISITSLPGSAEVTVDGRVIGRTPLVAHLDRKRMTTVVTIEAQGYRPYTIVLRRGVNNWVWANFFFFPGIVVDAVTGAMYKLTPESVAAELRESRREEVAIDENSIYVFFRPDPDVEGLELIGHLVPK